MLLFLYIYIGTHAKHGHGTQKVQCTNVSMFCVPAFLNYESLLTCSAFCCSKWGSDFYVDLTKGIFIQHNCFSFSMVAI